MGLAFLQLLKVKASFHCGNNFAIQPYYGGVVILWERLYTTVFLLMVEIQTAGYCKAVLNLLRLSNKRCYRDEKMKYENLS